MAKEVCLCGITWVGRPGCSYACTECGWDELTDEQEAALEEWEERRRDRSHSHRRTR